jgi:hypothetical protein
MTVGDFNNSHATGTTLFLGTTRLPFIMIARSSKVRTSLSPLFLYTSPLTLYTLFPLIDEGSKRCVLLRSLGNTANT